MPFWWVNQTWRQEVGGGYLWSSSASDLTASRRVIKSQQYDPRTVFVQCRMRHGTENSHGGRSLRSPSYSLNRFE
jgi:Rps23 Pro-64 3,4-dihydroxylase Tpa1-like proline 4-hydroxylase